MERPFVLMAILASTINAEGNQIKNDPIQPFFIGTYTGGESKGIYRADLNTSTGKLSVPELVITSDNPTFLAFSADKKFLLAANENNEKGTVESFIVSTKGELLKIISRVPSGGAHPCYVSANAEGYVLAANYSGGSTALFSMDNNGVLTSRDLKQEDGSGPVKGRQQKAHAHSSVFEPETDRIFVADLGTDKISIYQLDKDNHKLKRAVPVSEIKLPSGSGPRHMVFNDSKRLLYIACELSNTVSVADLSKAGDHPVIATLSTLPDNYNEESYVADIHMSKDGRFLYVSNRGLNTIAIFTVDSGNGELKLISQESTRGIYPRNFAFSPDEDYLIVANQKSQNIVAFKRNSETGELTFTDEVKAFTPVCVLFY